jgi:hypothetical protein
MPRLTSSTVETLVWVLIYGGLLLLSLGWFVGRDDAGLGWGLGILGAIAALTGVVLIYVRSRMKDSP